jgi:hypothetical protein
MRTIKSERLKKLEADLQDLERWLDLSLVPNKDIPKHKEEIKGVKNKIKEEKERLQFLRESGDLDELTTSKRSPSRSTYTEMPTVPDIDHAETQMANYTEASHMDANSEMYDDDDDDDDEDDDDEDEDDGEEDKDNKDKETSTDEEMVDDESYFSDKNRWRRSGRDGGIVDPEANEW